MRRIQLVWRGYYSYTKDNVVKYAPQRAGVYKISFEQSDGTLEVRYIGQSNDLFRRLKEHLDSDNEQNKCLAERIKKYHSKFSFAEIVSQNDRDGAERALYGHYRPFCNDSDAIPEGLGIEINYK